MMLFIQSLLLNLKREEWALGKSRNWTSQDSAAKQETFPPPLPIPPIQEPMARARARAISRQIESQEPQGLGSKSGVAARACLASSVAWTTGQPWTNLPEPGGFYPFPEPGGIPISGCVGDSQSRIRTPNRMKRATATRLRTYASSSVSLTGVAHTFRSHLVID